jgi:hypothetical protein
MKREDTITRRAFLLATTSAAGVACADPGEPVGLDEPPGPPDPGGPALKPTCEPPSPNGACELTPPDIEGPFYLPDSPERSELGMVGDNGIALALSGRVTNTGCVPLADLIIEIWHADPEGDYDNSETKNYRGWVRSDAEGRYAFTTSIPGRYPNAGTLRPAHIHMKIWRDGAELLTTQLYFQDDPYLEGDPWAEPARTMCLEPSEAGFAAVFDISLA